MKRHALFVGVNDYDDQSIKNLQCAVNDATDLHGFFKFGAGYDQVELLPNPKGKKDVLGAVRRLTNGLVLGDFFLFFFAGHGFRVGDNHVLVCASDSYDDVKHEDDGLPLGQLMRRLSGDFDSAILLDACQSDILATRGGEGIAERDINLILASTAERSGSGALTVVTSCDVGQTAAELSEMRHGLFTVAMLDLLKEAQKAHARLDLSDDFRKSLGRRMDEIAVRSQLGTRQRPRFSCPGDSCFVLLDGIAPSQSSQPPPPPPLPTPKNELSITDRTVKLKVDLPGCGESMLSFTLFETLSRYLCLLQGLGTHGGESGTSVFGDAAFLDSAWRAVTGSGESAKISCQSLTAEDNAAIRDAGGMEKLARTRQVGAIFKELKAELQLLMEELKKELRARCDDAPSVRNAFALVKEMAKSLQMKGVE